MRRRPFFFVGPLILGLLGLGWATGRGVAADPEKSSWTARLWPWSSKKVPEGQKDGSGQSVKDAKADFDAARRLRAELDWKRRAEICQKLRQIAYETKDEELDRFAERLDQRAWDVYIRQTGAGAASLSQDERVLAERIGVDFGLLEPSPKTLPAHADAAKTREERR